MKKIGILLLSHLIFCCVFAMNVSDTIVSYTPDQFLPDMKNLVKELGEGEMSEFPDIRQMLGGFQGAGEVLGQYDEEGAQFHMFDLPDELLQILPEGCRTIGKVTCVLRPNYAGIQFDTLTGRNDGKGYNFIVVVDLYDSDSQNEDVSERIELENLVLQMELDKLNKGIHPKHGEKLTGIKIKEWGAGGSFNYMDEWNGKKMVRYSSYYKGRVGDVYFTLEADGDDISVPEKVADKLASLVGSSLTYQSLKSRIIK